MQNLQVYEPQGFFYVLRVAKFLKECRDIVVLHGPLADGEEVVHKGFSILSGRLEVDPRV